MGEVSAITLGTTPVQTPTQVITTNGVDTSLVMNTNEPTYYEELTRLKSISGRLQALSSSQGIAAWDLETYMPQGANDSRSWTLGEMEKLSHEILTSKEVGNLLVTLRSKEVFDRLEKTDQALVREIGREYDKATKIPSDLVKQLTELETKAHQIWIEAKRNKNFNEFVPILKELVSLSQQLAECLGYKGSRYNALLDLYEDGANCEELDKLFNNLKDELIPLVKFIASCQKPRSDFLRSKDIDFEKQLKISKVLLELFGFDLSSNLRVDKSAHPFCTSIGLNDLRITIRPEGNIVSIVSTPLHEGGHALYDKGINPELFKTPLYDGASMGIHESQSRLMEILIGQGKSFWTYFYPKLKEFFPEELKGITLDEFYKAINIVEPSLIRVEADEITYQFHIILRYEIEKALIEGTLDVKDIPKAWNEKMQEYLGMVPTNDAEGALQDVHWSEGSFGYFPTYTLGNLYAAQFYNTVKKEIPNLEVEISKGNLKPLIDWLREKIHSYGRTETPSEIVQRVTGEPLNAKYFIDYILEKYSKLYPITLPRTVTTP